MKVASRVSDPAFFLIADPDPGSGSRFRIQGLMTYDGKKFIAGNLFSIFLIKIAIYLSLGLHKGCPSYRKKAFNPQKRTSST
jgi:hypothetical protein